MTDYNCSHAEGCTIFWTCIHREPHEFMDACTKRVPDKIDCKGICEPTMQVVKKEVGKARNTRNHYKPRREQP